jgi:hypothetical protein
MAATRFSVVIQGHLSAGFEAAFEPLTGLGSPDGTTVLSGELRDQSALFGILRTIERLGLTLLAVSSAPIQGDTHVQ